jgi:hypothetical protein
MTFQYFIGTIVFAFMLDFCVVVLLEGLFGLFYRPIGDRYLKVVVQNNSINY